MSSNEQPFSKDFSIIHATSSNLKGRIFFFCASRITSLLWRTLSFMFIPSDREYRRIQIDCEYTDREYRRIQIDPHLLQETAYLLWQSHHINCLASRDVSPPHHALGYPGLHEKFVALWKTALLSHCAAVQSSLRCR